MNDLFTTFIASTTFTIHTLLYRRYLQPMARRYLRKTNYAAYYLLAGVSITCFASFTTVFTNTMMMFLKGQWYGVLTYFANTWLLSVSLLVFTVVFTALTLLYAKSLRASAYNWKVSK